MVCLLNSEGQLHKDKIVWKEGKQRASQQHNLVSQETLKESDSQGFYALLIIDMRIWEPGCTYIAYIDVMDV